MSCDDVDEKVICALILTTHFNNKKSSCDNKNVTHQSLKMNSALNFHSMPNKQFNATTFSTMALKQT
ncbi:hypothetical protein B9T26_07855 [Acinetobacter sp. ANC 4169]|nr:hypothetical protein B9T26_07855 [Acinetobacter sp. ANC 4169]